jgi:hypothetical protein
MLKELKSVTQHEGGFRRLFEDDFFDLFIWYESPQLQQEMIGFQLCYDKWGRERALTWRKRTGFTHSWIDTGEDSPETNRTPILVPGGNFDPEWIIPLFKQSSVEVDSLIKSFVLNKLEEYKRHSEIG